MSNQEIYVLILILILTNDTINLLDLNFRLKVKRQRELMGITITLNTYGRQGLVKQTADSKFLCMI